MEIKIQKKNKSNNISNDNILESCLICGASTSGLHLQIVACYACSTFYRRSQATNKSFVCQKNSGDCDVTVKKPGKPLCRFCRYKKCVKVGMVLSKKKSENSNIPEYSKDFDEKEDFNSTNQQMLKALEIVSIEITKNYTKDFNTILQDFITKTKPKGTLVLLKSDNIRLEFVKKFYIDSAKMLSKYSPFSRLSLEEKILIHRKFWQIFHHFVLCYHSCQYFGNDINDLRLCIDDVQYVNHSKPQEFMDGVPVLLNPIFEKLQIFLKKFKRTNLTFYEFGYMCQIILWSFHEIPNISDSTQNLANKITEEISNDLHEYYTNEQRTLSYAIRQVQIFKLIDMAEFILRQKMEMLKAKEIFDFGQNRFNYCKFECDFYDFLNRCSLE